MCLCGPMVTSDCKVMGHVSLWSNGYQWLQGHGACASVVQWLPVTARSCGMCLCGPMVTSDCKVMGHVPLWSNGYQWLQGHGACASVVQWLPLCLVTARSWGMCLCGPTLITMLSDCRVMGSSLVKAFVSFFVIFFFFFHILFFFFFISAADPNIRHCQNSPTPPPTPNTPFSNLHRTQFHPFCLLFSLFQLLKELLYSPPRWYIASLHTSQNTPVFWLCSHNG